MKEERQPTGRRHHLCSHYRGACDADNLQRQVEVFGAQDSQQVLRLLHRCLDGTERADLFSFRVAPRAAAHDGARPSARLEWAVRGSTCLVLDCLQSVEQAQKMSRPGSGGSLGKSVSLPSLHADT